MASLPHHKSPCDSQVYIALGVCRGRETLGRGGELKNELKVVALICTSASVFSGCQSPTRLVTENWTEKLRKEQAPQAPEAAPRPDQVHAGLLILKLGGESRQDTATSLMGAR